MSLIERKLFALVFYLYNHCSNPEEICDMINLFLYQYFMVYILPFWGLEGDMEGDRI